MLFLENVDCKLFIVPILSRIIFLTDSLYLLSPGTSLVFFLSSYKNFSIIISIYIYFLITLQISKLKFH